MLLALILACTAPMDTHDTSDTSDTSDPGTCHGTPVPDGEPRPVLLSHPYSDAGEQAGTWERLWLQPDGTLERPGDTVTSGRAFDGEVAVTADGALAVAALDDGSLAVLALDDLAVVEEGWDEVYVDQVVLHPDGTHLYAVCGGWREHGGGVYRVELGCDGALGTAELIAAGKQPSGLTLRGDGTAFLYARDLGDSAEGDNAHILDLETGAVLASGPVFPDDEAVATDAAVSPDGRFGLVADNAAFTEIPNRVGVIRLDDMEPVATVEVDDPVALTASPVGGYVLAVSGYSHDVRRLSEPWDGSVGVAWQGAPPELPGALVAVERLDGAALLTEVSGLRQLVLTADGVTDQGRYHLGSGMENMAGALGVAAR